MAENKFTIGDFFTTKSDVDVPSIGIISAGTPTSLVNQDGNNIVPSVPFVKAIANLNLVKGLLVTPQNLVVSVQSSSSKHIYKLGVSVDKAKQEIHVVHKCKAMTGSTPHTCWHLGLAVIFADIILIKGRARDMMTEDWDKNSLLYFLEQVYQDLKEYEIVVEVAETKGVAIPPTTITLRSLNQLLIHKTYVTNAPKTLGSFVDPLGGLIIKETTSLIKDGIPFILLGEAGSGKTLLIEELAKHFGRKLYSTVVTSSMLAEDIVGMFKPSAKGDLKWQPGVLALAMLNGGIAYFDELLKGRGALLAAVYSALDHRKQLYMGFSTRDKKTGSLKDAVISAKPGFTVVAAGNPGYRYGNVIDDKALFDRFTPVFVPYLPQDEEVNLMVSKGYDKDIATRVVTLANKIRNINKEEGGQMSPFSTRLVEQICREAAILDGDIPMAVDRMTALFPPEEKDVIVKTSLSV